MIRSLSLFCARDLSGKVVIGEQRIGGYKTADAACWSAMALALQLRQEGSTDELRMHDENGIQRIWPPEQVTEVEVKRKVSSTNPMMGRRSLRLLPFTFSPSRGQTQSRAG